ncbi:MAG: leucyl/phenylalanyl-tRNA--protein transferase, partial [Paracoccaceae bacterium]
RTDASKVALAYLVDRLRLSGFTLFDTQFITPHLRSLGGQEIDRSDYLDRLERALMLRADISALRAPQTPQGVIQRNTQTS